MSLKSGAKLKFSYRRVFFFFPNFVLTFLSLGVFNFLCFDFEHTLKLLCYLWHFSKATVQEVKEIVPWWQN